MGRGAGSAKYNLVNMRERSPSTLTSDSRRTEGDLPFGPIQRAAPRAASRISSVISCG
jgi:hypothetical protein